MAFQPTDPEAMQLYQIIGAPLLAVVQAEVQAAQVSADFIRRVGFTPPELPGGPALPALPPAPKADPSPEEQTPPAQSADGQKPKAGDDNVLQFGGSIGDLRMAEFSLNRLDAAGNTRPFTVKIPVLSLFPIPLLQVKDAEFEYNIRILSRSPLQNPDQEDVQTGRAPSTDYLAPDRIELKGLLAPGSGERTSGMNIKVKIRMEQADVPIGLTKLLSVMDQHVSAVPAADEQGKYGK